MADVDAGSVDGAEVLGKIKQKLKDTIYENNVVAPVEDEVVLHKPGFKERYYKNKFHVDITKEPDFPRMVVKHYIEGVVWVLAYYYHGCVSWTWFYPFHYAPFASDFTELATLPLKFRRGEPFKPFEQLMAVLPPRSAHCLPSAHQKVMVETTSTVRCHGAPAGSQKLSFSALHVIPSDTSRYHGRP
jgi:5'-3' exoribonuclease 2